MKINTEYNIEQLVYLVTDPEQNQRSITAISVYPGGLVMYTLVCGTEETTHYGFEISTDKKIF